MRARRGGFTLVELLVVIAIIGILMALLLPAVQAARAAARRTSCKNNLKQVGLAMQLHHDSRQELPAGWSTIDRTTGLPDPHGDPGWGWCAHLLPYMEQANVQDSLIDFEQPLAAPAHDRVRVTVIPTLLCPSDPGPDLFDLHEEHGHGHGHGSGSTVTFPISMATSHFVGVFGTVDMHDAIDHHDGRGDGVFYRDRRTKFKDIKDGLSQTLVVGERSSEIAPSTWPGVVPDSEHGPGRVVGVAEDPPNSDHGHFHNFSSYHEAGVHFLAADGSVSLISETIDMAVYRALCTRAGGDLVTQP